MDPEDIANCQFVPIKAIEKTLDFLNEVENSRNMCKRDIWKLQKCHAHSTRRHYRYKFLKDLYYQALHSAIYKQDWNKLLYLLKRVPIWEQNKTADVMAIYFRALAILLMYHPSAQAQDLLKEYFHLVCTCRSDAEKNALMKIILTLPDTIKQRVHYQQRKLIKNQNTML